MIVAWLRFDGDGGFELVESMSWIPSIGVSYRVGVDGLSLPLAAMSALLFLVAVAYPADLRGRPRQYFAAFLFLERSEEHTSELQSLMRISYAVFCLKKKKQYKTVMSSNQ